MTNPVQQDTGDDGIGDIIDALEGAPCVCCGEACGEESFLHCDACVGAGCSGDAACKRKPAH